jgi:hypothetical protein
MPQPLFKKLVSSIATTAETGFEYRLYLAYDTDETEGAKKQFWTTETAGMLARMLQTHLHSPLKKRKIMSQSVVMPFMNLLRKPAPLLNFAMAAAFADGADYLYRVTDATVFLDGWAAATAAALTKFDLGVGAVFPACNGKASGAPSEVQAVTRYHMDVFKLFYPAALLDWFLEDWAWAV